MEKSEHAGGASQIATKRYYTRHEASVYLGMAYITLEQWAARGYGPPVIKAGKSCRYDVLDLDAFMTAQKAGGSAAA